MFEIFLILAALSVTCSLLGSFLILRNQAMMADALSHSVLLGIVLGFFISQSLDSPLLILGATLFGVLTVVCIDYLQAYGIAHDAATGLIFTFFFALAVILISMFARNVHLDLDMVLMGEVIFAPLYRIDIWGYSLPLSLVKSIFILVVIGMVFLIFYQRFALYLFEPRQAQLVGLSTKLLELMIVTLIALTCIIAFDAIGAISVITFLVAPAMTALFWAKHYHQLLLYALIIGLSNVTLGLGLALYFDLTVAGTCAGLALLVFISHYLAQHLMKR